MGGLRLSVLRNLLGKRVNLHLAKGGVIINVRLISLWGRMLKYETPSKNAFIGLRKLSYIEPLSLTIAETL